MQHNAQSVVVPVLNINCKRDPVVLCSTVFIARHTKKDSIVKQTRLQFILIKVPTTSDQKAQISISLSDKRQFSPSLYRKHSTESPSTPSTLYAAPLIKNINPATMILR